MNKMFSSLSKKKKICIILFVVFFLLYSLIEIMNIRFSSDNTTHEIIYGITTRLIGSLICVVMMFYCSYEHLLSLRLNNRFKSFLLILPCWLIAINNFPFISLINGTAVIEREWWLIILFFLQCFFIGLFEETAFRGCVFMLVLNGKHKTRADVFWSVIISSAVFGCVHIVNLFAGASIVSVLQQLGYSFLIGAMCAVVLLITKNIWNSVLIHAVFNFLGGLVPTLGKGQIWNSPTIIITVVLSIAVAIYTVMIFLKYDITKVKDLLKPQNKNEKNTY